MVASGETLVSALQPSMGTGDTQGVTLPKAPSPTGASGPGHRDLAEGLGPVPGQYLWRGLTTAATTGPAAVKGPLGRWALWNGRRG